MEFTITETFSYFGRLLHMTRDQVDYFQTLPNISNRLRADKRSFSNFSTFQKMIARCQYQTNILKLMLVKGANSERRAAKTTFTGDGFDPPTTNPHSG